MAGSEFGEDENGGKKIVSNLHVDVEDDSTQFYTWQPATGKRP